jgi:photosystem II stability/assembly factor-like uncharacterized protein
MPTPESFDGLLRARCIGPSRGGRVVAVSGSYHDPATFYFGACAGGVWKTTSAGDYWECVSDGFFTTASVGALAVAPSDSNVIYAGTGETTIRIDVSHGDGVYRSIDAGRTWVNTGLQETRHIGKITVHPSDPDTAWVAALGHAFGPNAERGVFKTTDGGRTWDHVLFVSDKAGAVDITHDANPRILYAAIWEASRSFWMLNSGGPESGLWQSRDGGETWTHISDRPGLPKGLKGKIGVSASPVRTGRVWALIEHATDGGLYRSDDMGDTWTKVSDDQNLLSRAWYYTHVTADPVDSDTVYVNNLDLHRSIDGGATFSTIPTPHGDNHDIWIDPANNRRMVQGNDGGACVSFNAGETWSTIYNQLTAQFYHLGISNDEPYVVYGTQQDNTSIAVPSQTNSLSIHWTHCQVAGTGESGYIQPHPDNPDVIYVGAIGSSPGGGNALQRYDRVIDQIRLITTWPEDTRGLAASEHKYRFNWTYPIVISPHDTGVIYVGGNMVFKSTDEGQTWVSISPDLSRNDPTTLQKTGGPVNLDSIGAETYATVFSLVESPRKKGLFWAGSDDGLIHISRDNAKTWKNVTPGDLPEWTMISGIELSPFDDKTAYVAGTRYKLDDYEPYLYVTRDLGKTWKRIDGDLPRNDFTRVIRCDPAVPGLLYTGTETGVYVSLNDGQSWMRLGLNLPVTPVHELIVHDDDLVVGTHGRSIWIIDDINPLRAVARDGVPDAAHLFSPRTSTRILPGIDWGNDVPGYVNYLGGVGGGYRVRRDDLGQTERTYLDTGENPPRGAILTWHLPEAPAGAIRLEITNRKGEIIRAFSSRLETDETPAKEMRIPAGAGWNRFVWDLRHAPATKIRGNDPPAEMTIDGPFVAPGEYTVTLTMGETSVSQPLSVIKPRNVTTPDADLIRQEALLLDMHRKIDRTVVKINQMRDLRTQLTAWEERAASAPKGKKAITAMTQLRERVLEIEQSILMPDLRAGWADGINTGARLFDKLINLPAAAQLGDYRPTDAVEEAFADIAAQIDKRTRAFDRLVKKELPVINDAIKNAGLGAVTVLA